MLDVIFMFAVVGVVVLPVAMFIGFFDWMARENRTFFFVKWWKRRSHKKNVQMILDIREEVGRN